MTKLKIVKTNFLKATADGCFMIRGGDVSTTNKTLQEEERN